MEPPQTDPEKQGPCLLSPWRFQRGGSRRQKFQERGAEQGSQGQGHHRAEAKGQGPACLWGAKLQLGEPRPLISNKLLQKCRP